MLRGGGIYDGLRGRLTATGVTGSLLFIDHNTAADEGGVIAAVDSTATTLTQTAVTVNASGLTAAAGGVYRSHAP